MKRSFLSIPDPGPVVKRGKLTHCVEVAAGWGDPNDQYEALATTPDALSFHFLVHAAFRLEGPGGSP